MCTLIRLKSDWHILWGVWIVHVDLTNFHRSWAWQIFLIFNTCYICIDITHTIVVMTSSQKAVKSLIHISYGVNIFVKINLLCCILHWLNLHILHILWLWLVPTDDWDINCTIQQNVLSHWEAEWNGNVWDHFHTNHLIIFNLFQMMCLVLCNWENGRW